MITAPFIANANCPRRGTGLFLAAARLCIPWMLIAAGCTSSTQPLATNVPPEQAEVSYWLDQPATAGVSHPSFDELFAAARRAAKNRSFEVSHADFRRGRLTTKPLLSKQGFEFWRGDVVDGEAITQSALATVRRTVRFDIEPQASGRFVLSPKVVVERRAVPERRVTDTAHYQAAVAGVGTGVAVDEQGDRLPTQYWYAIGRDEALERALARDVERLAGR